GQHVDGLAGVDGRLPPRVAFVVGRGLHGRITHHTVAHAAPQQCDSLDVAGRGAQAQGNVGAGGLRAKGRAVEVAAAVVADGRLVDHAVADKCLRNGHRVAGRVDAQVDRACVAVIEKDGIAAIARHGEADVRAVGLAAGAIVLLPRTVDGDLELVVAAG